MIEVTKEQYVKDFTSLFNYWEASEIMEFEWDDRTFEQLSKDIKERYNIEAEDVIFDNDGQPANLEWHKDIETSEHYWELTKLLFKNAGMHREFWDDTLNELL